MLTQTVRDKAKARREEILEVIHRGHLVPLYPGSGDVFLISTTYHGVWLEHAYDAISWVQYDGSRPEISLNQINLFLNNQKPDGQLPFNVTFGAPRGNFNQLQECVSFARVCRMALAQNPGADRARVYHALVLWDKWLEEHHSSPGGLLETFCGYDTGHDNSLRHAGFAEYERSRFPSAADRPIGNPVLPMTMPDMNAVVYGNRTTLADMAEELGLPAEAAEHRRRADALRRAIYTHFYDEADDFFYDVDKNGQKHKMRSIAITSLFLERVLDKDEGERLFRKYFLSPDYFGTPYPWPAVAISDPACIRNLPGNSWNYYAQGLVALRSTLWMDAYGLGKYLEENMEKWVAAWTGAEHLPFGQELDPLTGEPSDCSPYYSATMLYYLHALDRLGI